MFFKKMVYSCTLPAEEKRKVRCCFTGHRPQKLTRLIDDIKVDQENEILAAIKDGYTTFPCFPYILLFLIDYRK